MSADDEDENWQDECFKMMRVLVGVIAEYSSLIKSMDSPAGWALDKLRSLNRDLLQALEESAEMSTQSLLTEARVSSGGSDSECRIRRFPWLKKEKYRRMCPLHWLIMFLRKRK